MEISRDLLPFPGRGVSLLRFQCDVISRRFGDWQAGVEGGKGARRYVGVLSTHFNGVIYLYVLAMTGFTSTIATFLER